MLDRNKVAVGKMIDVWEVAHKTNRGCNFKLHCDVRHPTLSPSAAAHIVYIVTPVSYHLRCTYCRWNYKLTPTVVKENERNITLKIKILLRSQQAKWHRCRFFFSFLFLGRKTEATTMPTRRKRCEPQLSLFRAKLPSFFRRLTRCRDAKS